MAPLLDLLLIGPLLLAGLAMFGLTRDARWWQAPAANAEATAGAAPQQLGPYTLAGKIGEGAMGEVYRAWNSAAGAWHAVKVLPQRASASDRRRFEKEARLGALVRHPNTVSILEQAEERQGTCYYAMELVEGTNLEQLVQREGAQPPARVARILAQLGAALAEMHARGLVHRDIKPENVLLTGGERELCKLVDFGLAEHVGALAEGQPEGALIGTPLYISPEAIVAPEAVGPKSDLYGLGAVGYFLLRGEPMFRGSSLIEVCCHHLHSTPPPLGLSRDDACAAELERILLGCLAKDPDARPASAAEVARALTRVGSLAEIAGSASQRAARVRPCLDTEASRPTRAAECRIAA
jgi:serine/threonine protein kinase